MTEATRNKVLALNLMAIRDRAHGELVAGLEAGRKPGRWQAERIVTIGDCNRQLAELGEIPAGCV